mgnify:CR=1 FL=1
MFYLSKQFSDVLPFLRFGLVTVISRGPVPDPDSSQRSYLDPGFSRGSDLDYLCSSSLLLSRGGIHKPGHKQGYGSGFSLPGSVSVPWEITGSGSDRQESRTSRKKIRIRIGPSINNPDPKSDPTSNTPLKCFRKMYYKVVLLNYY